MAASSAVKLSPQVPLPLRRGPGGIPRSCQVRPSHPRCDHLGVGILIGQPTCVRRGHHWHGRRRNVTDLRREIGQFPRETRVGFRQSIEADIEINWLLAALAGPIVNLEMQRRIRRYLERARQALEAMGRASSTASSRRG